MTRPRDEIEAAKLGIEEDARFDAEVKELLRPGNSELYRGIRPETLAAMGLPPRRAPVRARRWTGARFATAGAFLAAAAASIALFAVQPHSAQAPTGEISRELSGALEGSRGTYPRGGDRRYTAESVLEIEISQPGTAAVRAVELLIFEVDREQRLRPVNLIPERKMSREGDTRFSASGKISAIFPSPVVGTKRLAFVLATYSSDSSEISGADLSDIERRPDLRCFVEDISIVSASH